MIYNLKKSETTEAETFEHLITVLYILIETDIENENYKNMKRISKYLKRYLVELLKQQYDKRTI